MSKIIVSERIVDRIYHLRGKKIMLDEDLSELYDVDNKQLKRQVRRNIARFPSDFMFVITRKEYNSLRSQFGTIKKGEHSKYLPFAFTEQGVAMLSSVLNSKQAISVNIQIMRVFTKMRELLLAHKDIFLKLQLIEKKLLKQDERGKKAEEEIQLIFKALKQLLNPTNPQREKIGYKRRIEK